MTRRRSTRSAGSTASTPLISLKRVSRFYGPDRAALFDISFDINPGSFVYIAGPSGAGKSTLLRLLHLSETADTGSILFSGHDVSTLRRSARAVVRRSMGVVFQDFRLVPELSVGENVGLPLEVAGSSRAEINAGVERVLLQVGLAGRGSERAGDLSGGEQQRVAIARALVGQPELILADEPTGSLDSYSADFVLELLEGAARAGAAVVLATHDRMLIASRPHRYLALDRGRLVGISDPPTRRGARPRPPEAAVEEPAEDVG